MAELSWIKIARGYIGTREIPGPKHNPLIVRMWKWIKRGGIKDDENPWCAGFVGACLEEAGFISSRFEGASSYLRWGRDCPMVYGCVVVITRAGGSGYHVGFAVGKDRAGNILVLGGNQDNQVKVSAFAANRIRARRWPGALEIALTPLPLLGPAAASGSES
jgi:uncharacterized protein (TIGR02594 family)